MAPFLSRNRTLPETPAGRKRSVIISTRGARSTGRASPLLELALTNFVECRGVTRYYLIQAGAGRRLWRGHQRKSPAIHIGLFMKVLLPHSEQTLDVTRTHPPPRGGGCHDLHDRGAAWP